MIDDTALDDCIATYRRWLHMPDPGALEIVLAAVAANLRPGDPVWLMVVGPPSSAKTETMQPLAPLPYVHAAATVTVAALLSGTPKKEHENGAKGGLLRQVGEFGVLLLKDFTSVLAQNRDSRGEVLAALREIYDGEWTRHVGTGGGTTLAWKGKLGLVAGCTPTIDLHHAVVGSMGERMVLFRLPELDPDTVAATALAHIGQESEMRRDLQLAVADVLRAAEDREPQPLDPAVQHRLQALGVFAARARTAVERDSHTREVLMIPQAEGPGRFVRQLGQLHQGLAAIGVDCDERWRLLTKLAVDSMPAARATALRELIRLWGTWDADELKRGHTTAHIATQTGLPTQTARRQLEDLTLLGLAHRDKKGEADNAPDLWEASRWAREHWPSVPESPGPISKTANTEEGIPGTLDVDAYERDYPDLSVAGERAC